jgi:hypothetical protein
MMAWHGSHEEYLQLLKVFPTICQLKSTAEMSYLLVRSFGPLAFQPHAELVVGVAIVMQLWNSYPPAPNRYETWVLP